MINHQHAFCFGEYLSNITKRIANPSQDKTDKFLMCCSKKENGFIHNEYGPHMDTISKFIDWKREFNEYINNHLQNVYFDFYVDISKNTEIKTKKIKKFIFNKKVTCEITNIFITFRKL